MAHTWQLAAWGSALGLEASSEPSSCLPAAAQGWLLAADPACARAGRPAAGALKAHNWGPHPQTPHLSLWVPLKLREKLPQTLLCPHQQASEVRCQGPFAPFLRCFAALYHLAALEGVAPVLLLGPCLTPQDLPSREVHCLRGPALLGRAAKLCQKQWEKLPRSYRRRSLSTAGLHHAACRLVASCLAMGH